MYDFKIAAADKATLYRDLASALRLLADWGSRRTGGEPGGAQRQVLPPSPRPVGCGPQRRAGRTDKALALLVDPVG